jgi:hypothetical protein
MDHGSPEISEITLARKLAKSQTDAELFGYTIQNQEAKSGYPNSSPLNYEPERLTTIGKNERFATRQYRDFRGHYESLEWFSRKKPSQLRLFDLPIPRTPVTRHMICT